MRKKRSFVVGSRSSIKIRAVREALTQCRLQAQVIRIEVPSGQNAQPIGFDETLAGALTRAQGARKLYPQSVAIGIENGLLAYNLRKKVKSANKRTSIFIDFAVIVMIDERDVLHVGTSAGIQFPADCVEEARLKGFSTTTVGSVISASHSCSSQDPHAHLLKKDSSQPSVSPDGRQRILTESLTRMLRQIS